MLRPSLSSNGIDVHVPIMLFDSLRQIFISIFFKSPGLNVIRSGEYNVKTLFSKLFRLFIFLSTKKVITLDVFRDKKMITKCLLCNFKENNSPGQMKRHYTDVHKVDENNKFFINLLKPSVNVFCGRKCLRCDIFYRQLI